MIQSRPARVQHNNNKSLFWCTKQSENGSGIPALAFLLESIREHSDISLVFLGPHGQLFSVFNDKSAAVFECVLLRIHHGAATVDLAPC